jgi:hypothetical protein
MNTKVRTLLASFALTVSVAALPALGGELEPLKVTVPFAFTAGKTNLPAGDYTVSENDAHLVTIRGVKTSVMILGTPGSESDSDRSALSFERTVKGYSLKSIQASGRAASLVPTVSTDK